MLKYILFAELYCTFQKLLPRTDSLSTTKASVALSSYLTAHLLHSPTCTFGSFIVHHLVRHTNFATLAPVVSRVNNIFLLAGRCRSFAHAPGLVRATTAGVTAPGTRSQIVQSIPTIIVYLRDRAACARVYHLGDG